MFIHLAVDSRVLRVNNVCVFFSGAGRPSVEEFLAGRPQQEEQEVTIELLRQSKTIPLSFKSYQILNY